MSRDLCFDLMCGGGSFYYVSIKCHHVAMRQREQRASWCASVSSVQSTIVANDGISKRDVTLNLVIRFYDSPYNDYIQ